MYRLNTQTMDTVSGNTKTGAQHENEIDQSIDVPCDGRGISHFGAPLTHHLIINYIFENVCCGMLNYEPMLYFYCTLVAIAVAFIVATDVTVLLLPLLLQFTLLFFQRKNFVCFFSVTYRDRLLFVAMHNHRNGVKRMQVRLWYFMRALMSTNALDKNK